MIYTRFGAPVRILRAWTEMQEYDGEQVPVWFCDFEITGPYPDGSSCVGEVDKNGQAGAMLTADDGWGEIENACTAVEDKQRSAA